MATPQTVAFHTLGCKLNFSETSSIRRKFEDLGFGTVGWDQPADIYVLNTCSVTEFADRKCRSAVRKALRQRPDARVVVMGCYAQLKPEEIANIEGVDLVLGAAEKFNLHHYIESLSKSADKGMIKSGEINAVNTFEEAFSFGDRTRSFLKVQDGCDYKCSFCTIPLARGVSRSPSIEKIIQQAKLIADHGVKEIVLTGVNIGDFGKSSEHAEDHSTFLDLIQRLDDISGIERFRISSIEPNLCTDDVISFVAQSQRFVPHFHMPLQSGSDNILRLMRRRYKRQLYLDRVEKIKSLMSHCCIGVDVIVGFPGETENEFKTTVEFLSTLDISYLHVFTYSERENTPAKGFPGKVPLRIRRNRNSLLRLLSDKKKREFYKLHLDTARTVLFEHASDGAVNSGFTDNYIKVEVPATSHFPMTNALRQVSLMTLQDNGCVKGKICDDIS